MPLKDRIIDTLEGLAKLSSLAGHNQFKIRALENAARVIKNTTGDMAELYHSGALAELPGIGKGILHIISQVVAHEPVQELAELSALVPPGVVELTELSSLGPKRARQLWQELDIKNVGELEYAIKENRLQNLKGFGPKMQAALEQSLALRKARAGSWRIDQLLKAAHNLSNELKEYDGIHAIEIVGELARGTETGTQIELLVLVSTPVAKAQAALNNLREATPLPVVMPAQAGIQDGATTLDAGLCWHDKILFAGIPTRIYFHDEPKTFGLKALFLTGSDKFLAKLISFANKHKFELSPKQFTKNHIPSPASTQEQIFEALGLYYVATERREKNAVLVAVGTAPVELVSLLDLKGCFHNHTIASDGTGTISQMRERAIELRLGYLSINDHSHSAFYASGLNSEQVLGQVREIAQLNQDDRALACQLLSGTESDILADGALDFPDDVLDRLEIVIASVHSRLGLNAKQMTARMCRAARNPRTTIIGHPTGRLLLARPPSDFDMRALLEAAHESGTAVELNANPHRLDLNEKHLGLAKEMGVMIAINPDAHSTQGIEDLSFGITIARRAGLSPAHVLNCLGLNDIKKWLKAKREKFIL